MVLSRKTFWFVFLVSLLLVLAVAYAQGGELDPGNPATWFATAAGWGVMVMFIINFLKANVMPNLAGARTIMASFVVAVGGSLLASTGLLSVLGINLAGSLGEVLTFGVTAFAASSGAWDTAKRLALAGKSK